MNYSQKTIDKSKEFQSLELSDAFNEVKISIDVLSMLELSALGDNFGSSVQKIIHNAIDELDAIQYLIETNYVEKKD